MQADASTANNCTQCAPEQVTTEVQETPDKCLLERFKQQTAPHPCIKEWDNDTASKEQCMHKDSTHIAC